MASSATWLALVGSLRGVSEGTGEAPLVWLFGLVELFIVEKTRI